MRQAFVSAMIEIAERDPRVLLMTGDLGFMALEPFADRFPDRFINVGVAEQNMVGLATGLAEAGMIPYIYSIVTFATLRPYEFIRNGPVLHRLPVRIVGMGGGFEYGSAGPTHHGLEDVGVMRLQAGLMVLAPADHRQARAALCSTWNMPGPVYFRLGKDDKTVVPGLDGRFDVGRAQLVREGTDVALIAMGAVAAEAADAAARLEAVDISCSLVVVASLNPPPVEDLVAALQGVPVAVTVEAHYVCGGLGSLVSEVVAERSLPCRVIRTGVHAAPSGLSGSAGYFHETHGLSAARIVDVVTKAIPSRA